MWIMVSGPYSTGARSDEERAANLARLNAAALEVHRRGHVPIVAIQFALPLAAAAGHNDGPVLMPLCRRLAERCDAVLRLPGVSRGADEEVAIVEARGGEIFRRMSDIPPAD